MKPFHFFLFVLVISAIILSPVNAHSISFADVASLQPMTVTIYESDGTYYGTWNTSSQGIVLDANESYYISLKAEGVDTFTSDPVGTLEDAVNFIQAHAFGFILLIIILILVVAVVKK